MALPHFRQSRASINKYEPIQNNLFEVTLFTPNGDDTSLILEHVKMVDGLDGINPSYDAVTQKYKFADRSYAGMPTQTFVDITVNFTLNLNDANENYIYNAIRNWRKLAYDPITGEMGLKRDYVGSMIVVQYNRAGDIFRQVTLNDIFPINELPFPGSLDYESQEAVELSQTFRCDYWLEENVGEA